MYRQPQIEEHLLQSLYDALKSALALVYKLLGMYFLQVTAQSLPGPQLSSEKDEDYNYMKLAQKH